MMGKALTGELSCPVTGLVNQHAALLCILNCEDKKRIKSYKFRDHMFYLMDYLIWVS